MQQNTRFIGTCLIDGKPYPICNTRRIQGRTFYWVQLNTGYYDDPEDGSRRYDSNLIKFDWFTEDQVTDVTSI